MTRERDIERVLEAWLEPGPSVMPDRVFDAVLDRIEREPQRRGSGELAAYDQTASRRSPNARNARPPSTADGQLLDDPSPRPRRQFGDAPSLIGRFMPRDRRDLVRSSRCVGTGGHRARRSLCRHLAPSGHTRSSQPASAGFPVSAIFDVGWLVRHVTGHPSRPGRRMRPRSPTAAESGLKASGRRRTSGACAVNHLFYISDVDGNLAQHARDPVDADGRTGREHDDRRSRLRHGDRPRRDRALRAVPATPSMAPRLRVLQAGTPVTSVSPSPAP